MSEQGKHAGTISMKKNALEIGIGTPLVPIRTTFYYDGKSSALYVEVRFSQLKCMDKAYADLEWLLKYSAFQEHERFCGHQPSILMIRPQFVSHRPPT